MLSFLYIVSIISAVSCNESVDWSPFEVVETLNGKDNVDIIKALPIQQYWDVQKGSFRTGLLGEHMSVLFPQFTSFVERKIIRAGKNMGMDNHIVDTSSLYMCSLSAIQQLAKTDLDLLAKQALVGPSISDTSGGKRGVSVELGDASLTEFNVLTEAMMFKRSGYNSSYQRYLANKSHGFNRINVRGVRKVEQYLHAHSDLMTHMASHLSNTNISNVQKFSALQGIAELMEENRYRQKSQALAELHQGSVLALHRTINITMEALAFRAAAELAATNAQRVTEEQQILAVKSELLQAEVEKVVDTFFAEVSSYVLYIQTNPAVALLVLRNGLIGAFLVLLCFELAQLCLLVLRKLSGTSYLPRVTRLGASRSWRGWGLGWWWSANSADVTVGTDTLRPLSWSPAPGEQLDRVLDSLSAAIGNRLALPNLLVAGPAGSGKSSMARATLQHIGQAAAASGAHVSCMMLCGADLQALGNGAATGFLNDLIRKYSCQMSQRTSLRWREALILVIDDADSIVAARSSAGGVAERSEDAASSAHGSLNGSLFALLTGLRENSPFVSVVLTSRLPLRAVDGAVLDRLDFCIELELPSAQERLQCLMAGLATLRVKAPRGHSDTDAVTTATWKQYDDLVASDGALPMGVADLLGGNLLDLDPDLDLVLASLPPTHRETLSTRISQLRDGIEANEVNSAAVDDNASASGSSSCPEMDLPCDASAASVAAAPSSHTFRRVLPAQPWAHPLPPQSVMSEGAAILALLHQCSHASASDPAGFRLSRCLLLALLVSAKWSYRDLKQFLSALNYNIMCSESCQVSTRMWIQELIYSFD